MKIEEGKYYRTRDGQKVGPVCANDDRKYPWRVEKCILAANGHYYASNLIHGRDLVAEWEDEPAAPPQYESPFDGRVTVKDTDHARWLMTQGWRLFPNGEDHPHIEKRGGEYLFCPLKESTEVWNDYGSNRYSQVWHCERATLEPTPAPKLTIQEGWIYQRNDGEWTSPMRPYLRGSHNWVEDRYYYHSDGPGGGLDLARQLKLSTGKSPEQQAAEQKPVTTKLVISEGTFGSQSPSTQLRITQDLAAADLTHTNGAGISYGSDTITFYEEPKMSISEIIKTKATTVRETLAPYEKYIWALALLFLVDHFFLGGRLRERLTEMARTACERLIGFVECGIDKVLPPAQVDVTPTEEK